ncbi:MAG: AAA family ATPase [Thermoplasmatota archaeon]
MVTITVSGTPGSGKSTIACMLKERLNIPYIYSGMIFRSLAEMHHMSLADFGRYCEQHEEVDQELDDKQLEFLRKGNVIVEGRLAGWLAYLHGISAFKVMIDADVSIRAQRVVEREQGTVEQRKQEIINREESEWKRYKKYYDIDLRDTSIYDLVIDSSSKNPEEVMERIISCL